MNELFVVRYRNRHAYSGLDMYIGVSLSATVHFTEAHIFRNRILAEDAALAAPVVSQAHLPAELVSVTEVPPTERRYQILERA